MAGSGNQANSKVDMQIFLWGTGEQKAPIFRPYTIYRYKWFYVAVPQWGKRDVIVG